MDITATFVWPREAEGPELVVAWDEFCIDNNREGWEKERAERIAAYGDELRPDMVRDIILRVDYDKVERSFFPPLLDGQIP